MSELTGPQQSAPTPPQSSSPKNILIVENHAEWRGHIGRVVTDLCPTAILHYANDSQEALRIIADIETVRDGVQGKVDLVLSDLHMGGPEQNGDHLLATLMERETPTPAFAINSGTLEDKAKIDLIQRLPQIPLIEKDAFLPMNDGTPIRETLNQNLQRLLNGELPPIPKDPQYLQTLRSMKDRFAKVAKMEEFADQIKGKIGGAVRTHTDYLRSLDNSGFLLNPSLYDKSGEKIHDFKNQLSLFIDFLKTQEDLPKGLFEALIGLQVFITRTFNALMQQSPTFDALEACENVVANFRKFLPEDTIVVMGRETPVEVSMTPEVFYEIVTELIQNALTHSSEEQIYICFEESGGIRITNSVEKEIPFTIKDNELVYGQLPDHSTVTTGSAQGLKSIIKKAEKAGIKLSIWMEEGSANASLVLPTASSPGATASAKESRERLEMGTVLFYCHDRTPKSTFKALLATQVEGFNYEILEIPRLLDDRWLEENRRLFEGTCLLIAHVDGLDIQNILDPIYRKYPHITILPATLMPSSLNLETNRYEVIDWLSDVASPKSLNFISLLNLLGVEEIQRYLLKHPEAEDPTSDLYRKSYTPGQWETLLAIAHEKALERKRNN